MTPNRLILVAACLSFALLAAAFAFEHIGGLRPCKLCIWQRWPHAVAVLAGVAALSFRRKSLLAAAAGCAVLAGAMIGVYHVGVELHWWQGPDGCTAPIAGDMSAEELLEQILATPVVRCDDVPWSLGGVSMAGWNAIMSAAGSLLWFRAALAASSRG